MSLTALRVGIDTLEASIGGALAKDASRVLAEWKSRAQELDKPLYMPLDGLDFALQPQGAKPYRYKLAGDEASIRLSDSLKLPGASVRLSALGLVLYEPLDLYNLVTGSVGKWFGPAEPGELSRIDVAADFQGFDPAHLGHARFVCPAHFRPIYPNVDSPETYMFGKGPLVVRVYNKTREIVGSGKTWLPALWAEHPGYAPEADVWRFEVQLRRDTLRELGYSSPESAIRDTAEILRYGLGWADLRIPEGRSSDRWPRHPAWEELDKATGTHTTLKRELIDHSLAQLSLIVPIVAGYAVSAGAALSLANFREVWDILGCAAVSRFTAKDGYAGAVRARQIERIGKGDTA